jgi:hypothetical protein
VGPGDLTGFIFLSPLGPKVRVHAEEGAIHLVLPPRASRVQLAFNNLFRGPL